MISDACWLTSFRLVDVSLEYIPGLPEMYDTWYIVLASSTSYHFTELLSTPPPFSLSVHNKPRIVSCNVPESTKQASPPYSASE